MATAIIGIGNIGGTLARHLVGGGEPVVLAGKDEANAAALAQELGPFSASEGWWPRVGPSVWCGLWVFPAP
jgi:8-hydroxy-5-deazaflavin:NADPH oxidoreductase